MTGLELFGVHVLVVSITSLIVLSVGVVAMGWRWSLPLASWGTRISLGTRIRRRIFRERLIDANLKSGALREPVAGARRRSGDAGLAPPPSPTTSTIQCLPGRTRPSNEFWKTLPWTTQTERLFAQTASTGAVKT